MEDERMEQNRQPEKADVVFFSPEMLRLADQHRREQQERLENCRQAARNGDCAAAVQMGLHYFYGTGGVKKDPDKAFAWFSRTEPDDPTALYWLAVCHDNGTGVERDLVRAFELFQESAKLGYLPAVCDLGVCYENGQGTEKDLDRAIRCYRHAAEEGYAQGQCNLGPCITSAWGWRRTTGRRPGSSPKRRSSNIHGRSSCWACAMSSATAWSRMPKRRRFCNQEAGKGGSAEGLCALGVLHHAGKGVEKNDRRAAELFRQAAELGLPRAQLFLGHCYDDGMGVDQSPPQAVEWFRQAAQTGYPDAVMQLGLCYLYGHGTATDEKQAAELFQQAASAGNIRAMNELGLCYEAGRGVEKDIHRAAELYRQAAQSGMAAAQCNLGVLYREGSA